MDQNQKCVNYSILNCKSCNCKFSLESYNESPYALPCGHSFCGKCINENLKFIAYIQCYECKSKHFQDKSKLPLNKFLICLLQNDQEGVEKNMEILTSCKIFYKYII